MTPDGSPKVTDFEIQKPWLGFYEPEPGFGD